MQKPVSMPLPAAGAADPQQIARRLFEAGYNCAQSVAGAFWPQLGVSLPQALALSAGFGAGIARLRETCGAVSGMVLVMSAVLGTPTAPVQPSVNDPLEAALAPGRADPHQKAEVYRQIQERIRAFEAENGSSLCRELLGLRAGQKDAPTPQPRTAAYYAERPCLRMVLCAVRLTQEWLAARPAAAPAGQPPAAAEEAAPPAPLNADWYAAHRPQRPADGHKGTFGKVLAVCGSVPFRGAAALCCEAALRSGAGLVQLAAPPVVCSAVAARLPEVTFLPLEAADDAQNAADTAAAQKSARALVLGCGLGQGPRAAALVAALLSPQTLPAVLDADALNLLAALPQTLQLTDRPTPPRVLTPHIGEMARLLGVDTQTVLADQTGTARRAARDWGSVVVLKSSRTVIAAPDGRALLLDAPNSGLAKGGSGDVPAGLIGGLLAQGLPAFEAAGCGVWLHSAAARRAAAARGEAAMLATDVLANL